jgi:epoxyqueuosine reductase QueG
MEANMQANDELKALIKQFSQDAGADIIGFAPVERWNEYKEVPVDFRPQALWEPARTVIVLGVGIPLPIVETTPSILHKETYDTANRTLDAMAFNMVRYLNRLGHAAYFFTRDGFGSLRLLKDRPQAAFGHIIAAKYAGLGTVGLSNCLLTPEFGSRVRFVSVFTSAVLPPDPVIEKDLCIKCEACSKCCPVDALTLREDQIKGDYNVMACIDRHMELTGEKAYPCGICTKVCPIGKDRLLYKQKGIVKKYLQEEEALASNPNDPAYKTWTHVRKYGSWNKDYPRDSKSTNKK